MTNETEIKSKKPIWKKWWLWLIAIFVIFIFIGAIGGEKKGTTPEQQLSQEQEQTHPQENSQTSPQEVTSEQQLPQEQTQVQETSQTSQQATKEYPSFSEETMNRNCILSCAGGDEVVLWDKPTDAAGGARLHDKVPCGTHCWAFNKYYNQGLDFTFYAVNTFDPNVKNSYGWITEDLITWLD
ncbi:MAG: hypothetical protein PHQ76_00020 [Caldisericia bacterium]|nr:hypothetical protein [Caldisericia bacterium]